MFFLKSNLLLLISTFAISLFVENKPEVSIAPYKNDAEGAYTIIHDDFGGHWASGIEQYADTMAYNRNIPLCIALIAGQCDETDWKTAAAMIQRGHQIVNHSMNHLCGKKSGECSPGVTNWDEKNFSTEIDSSESLIVKHTGRHPAFFMFPFDVHTDTMISYLRHKGYAGARAGQRDILTQRNPEDPFYLNFKAFLPGQTATDLNSFTDEAVNGKGWAIREVHGVEDGSWGSIPEEDYRIHLDYVKKSVDAGKLWVGTLSEILLYRYNAENYKVTISGKDAKERPVKIKLKMKSAAYRNSKIYSSLKKSSASGLLTIVITNMTDSP